MNNVAFSGMNDKDQDGSDVQSEAKSTTGTEVTSISKTSAPRITPREMLDFQLVRPNDGKLLEIATPLLGLCTRVRSAENYDNVEELHARIKNEIENFSTELASNGYDKATIQAARYCLCTMIDESVMGQHWGAESVWSETTMLSIFHNETWGGEKFFAILDRLINDASRFPDLLEFLYMCMLLGFEGKYHVAKNGPAKLDHLMQQINEILLEKNAEDLGVSLTPEKNVVRNARNLKKRLSVQSILLIALGAIVLMYACFAIYLGTEVSSIGNRITELFANFSNSQ